VAKTSEEQEKAPFIYGDKLYLAACLDCARENDLAVPIRMPFSSEDKMNDWVSRHTEDRDHEDIRYITVATADWRHSQ
jgi:hypothetical protein